MRMPPFQGYFLDLELFTHVNMNYWSFQCVLIFCLKIGSFQGPVLLDGHGAGWGGVFSYTPVRVTPTEGNVESRTMQTIPASTPSHRASESVTGTSVTLNIKIMRDNPELGIIVPCELPVLFAPTLCRMEPGLSNHDIDLAGIQ